MKAFILDSSNAGAFYNKHHQPKEIVFITEKDLQEFGKTLEDQYKDLLIEALPTIEATHGKPELVAKIKAAIGGSHE